jgi:hypothetical protein
MLDEQAGMELEDKKIIWYYYKLYHMGSVMSKFCACIFCCCPNKNCYDREKREIEIIYNQIRQLDDCFVAEDIV